MEILPPVFDHLKTPFCNTSKGVRCRPPEYAVWKGQEAYPPCDHEFFPRYDSLIVRDRGMPIMAPSGTADPPLGRDGRDNRDNIQGATQSAADAADAPAGR